MAGGLNVLFWRGERKRKRKRKRERRGTGGGRGGVIFERENRFGEMGEWGGGRIVVGRDRGQCSAVRFGAGYGWMDGCVAGGRGQGRGRVCSGAGIYSADLHLRRGIGGGHSRWHKHNQPHRFWG